MASNTLVHPCTSVVSNDLSPTRVPRSRCRRWRKSRTCTAVVGVAAVVFSTTAWLCLVFSANTNSVLFLDWEGSPLSESRSFFRSIRPPVTAALRNRSLSEERLGKEELSLEHLMFGIAGSSQLWKRRKEFVRLWWRPDEMRGHVWLEELPPPEDSDDSLPQLMISGDISRFRYTNPTGHPSGLRISRIITESFRLGLPDVRWFVLGDDDTIFNVENLVAVLSKYDSAEMVYIGSPSESHSANTYFSHSMAYGGGGIAISYPLAEGLANFHDRCIERYPKLYGSDDRLHACITELGVPLTREQGFHISGTLGVMLTVFSPHTQLHHLFQFIMLNL